MRCDGKLHSSLGFRSVRCSAEAKVLRETGSYCLRHDPVSIREKSDAKRQARDQARERRMARALLASKRFDAREDIITEILAVGPDTTPSLTPWRKLHSLAITATTFGADEK